MLYLDSVCSCIVAKMVIQDQCLTISMSRAEVALTYIPSLLANTSSVMGRAFALACNPMRIRMPGEGKFELASLIGVAYIQL